MPTQKKKKVKRWSKVAAVGPLYMFNYNIAIELWVMETENSQKLFSVSITHNSKIRELSDGNRVIVCQTELLFAKQSFYYGSRHFWVMSYGNRELSYQKTQSKQALGGSYGLWVKSNLQGWSGIRFLCMWSCGSQVFNLVFFRNKVAKPYGWVFKGELCKILETAKGGTPQGQQRVKIFNFIVC